MRIGTLPATYPDRLQRTFRRRIEWRIVDVKMLHATNRAQRSDSVWRTPFRVCRLSLGVCSCNRAPNNACRRLDHEATGLLLRVPEAKPGNRAPGKARPKKPPTSLITASEIRNPMGNGHRDGRVDIYAATKPKQSHTLVPK